MNNVVSKETQDDIQKQTNIIVTSHSQRLAQLQSQLLEEERLGADHNLIPSYQDFHQNAAQRIKNLIQTENDNFQREIKSLNIFIEQLR